MIQINYINIIISLLTFVSFAKADFFQEFFQQGHGQQQQHHGQQQFFQQGHGQQQQQQGSFDMESAQLNSNCEKYLCPSTFECVDSPVDCSCQFPKSQIKCILPNKKDFICIPKVKSDELHDDQKSIVEIRDCDWLIKAWNGLV
ncbi:hypothetical protein B5S28_g1798 [[Candida] boidinii]|uniref:Unnamed protein product n=1 Tax=Candida boidinii TaxID=5477 RepID=A0ACB5TVD5_CANBO|nr:hypothetical protein B5S28_g1798 [[Candida] boidinii]OWB60628.1 hypothetical protein B5S29_g1506 [[Candida] boidinii]OWB70824.1 hypothetical protein B5S31_g505 [[Candida] boidinii]OWB76713.1 hypothetical protein B5S32_g868 [[Candida] boidinii]GME96208.1 unnamed protein product [[Candida] boidinii]